jgi:predicted DNA-binding protein
MLCHLQYCYVLDKIDFEVVLMALKSRVRLCNSIDKSLFEKLQRLSKETMIPMSKLLDKAIEKLLEEYGKLR